MGHYATEEQLISLVSDMASKINIAGGTEGVSGSYTPVGTIIAYMGTTAPADHLACDGSLHQIASYPQLADFFYENFGASNYFGGNGTTTFAVPDLRGEFLRGTGTNSHTNQGSGANVGTHQDATEHRVLIANDAGVYVTYNATAIVNEDSELPSENKYVESNSATTGASPDYKPYTSRPTNTSILWCIKAIDFKAPAGMVVYSEQEHIVSQWITGEAVYEKTIVDTTPLTTQANTRLSYEISTTIPNIKELVALTGYLYVGSSVIYGLNAYKCSADGRTLAVMYSTFYVPSTGKFMLQVNGVESTTINKIVLNAYYNKN